MSDDDRPCTLIVAIDGPAGAGKSSVSKEVAKRLGMAFLDTGAMYRAATWWAMHREEDLENAEALIESTRAMPLEMHHEDDTLRIRVGEDDITDAIRSPEVTKNIKKLDGIPGVREHLVRLQRELGTAQPTVAEGRDMGTVVFPDACCKIYLDASLEERTRRRAEQLTGQGREVDMAVLREEIAARDRNDTTRTVGPLRKADDAYVLDTSALSFDEVVEAIVARARAAL